MLGERETRQPGSAVGDAVNGAHVREDRDRGWRHKQRKDTVRLGEKKGMNGREQRDREGEIRTGTERWRHEQRRDTAR